MSQFSHINVNMSDLTFCALTCFLFLTFMKEWTSPQHRGGTSASVAPIDFPFPGHSRGRMMHSLRDADCYSCRCAVPLRKGEPTDDIMELHGRLSGWVRWMWADWKSQHSLCCGTKSSCGEDTSYSVSIKTWVSRRKLNCTVYSTSAEQQIIPQERLALTCSRSLIRIRQHQHKNWIKKKLNWSVKLIFRTAD